MESSLTRDQIEKVDWYVPPPTGGWGGRIKVTTFSDGKRIADLYSLCSDLGPQRLTATYINPNITSGWWHLDNLAVAEGL